MATTKLGNFVNTDDLAGKIYSDLLDEATPKHGVLITEGTESAQIILEAFPAEGYTLRDAMELRDLILNFNKQRFLTPTTL